MYDYDVLIIGCGISGAAAAYMLARYDLKTGIIERSNDVANGTTKANSAILHAGYDPAPGSLMARLNRRGISMARDICRRLDIEYRPMPSLVIAFNERDMNEVHRLYERGIANGVSVRILSREEALAVEPSLNPDVVGALFSDESAIVNPWEYATAMAETAVLNGTELMLEQLVTGIEKNEDGTLTGITDKGSFRTRFIVNAAGCFAGDICRMVGDDRITQTNYAGQYYVLDKSEGARVGSVIFRCPDENGFKGILVTPTVHGNLLVGPDASPVSDGDNTATDSATLAMLKKRGLESVPGINFREVIHEYAGVRPTTQYKDFIIDVSPACPQLINLAGICSPGLSAAPAIGEEAVRLLAEQGLELKERADFKDTRPPVIRFAELSEEEKQRVAAENPAYGRIVCRCETVTEGEIVEAIHRPIVPRSVDAIKRRCRAGMGRCQGGFCSPRVHAILARELGVPMTEITLDSQGSFILTGCTKGADN